MAVWMVVDDEPDIVNVVSIMFQVWGHTPIIFYSGTEVWKWLDAVETGSYQSELPQFILMDIRMPGKYGYELARRMRAIPRLRHLPIALMTAFALNDEEWGAMMKEYGPDY